MALKLADRIQDQGLAALRDEADQIWVLSSSPADYAAAVVAKLGTATAAFGNPSSITGGRRIANPPISGGSVTAVGTVSHWAAVDTVNSRLLASDTVSSGALTSMGMAWSLGEIAVRQLGALSVSPPVLADAQAYVDQDRGMFITWSMATYAGTEFIDPTLFPPSSFNPTGLDIPQWAQVAKDFNCAYAVFTIKHKDGFTLWPTATTERGLANSPWYAANGNLDIAQAYVNAFGAAGVKPYFYFSVKDDYWLITHPGWTNAEFKAFTQAQMTEVLTRYGKPGAIWLDATFAHMGDASPWTSATERNNFIRGVAPGIIIIDNCDLDSRTVTDIVEYESTPPPGGNTVACECCFSIGGPTRWFWKADDQPNADANSIATTITNTNARNGAALVGISPNAVGVVPQAFIARIEQVGMLLNDIPRVSPNNMTSNTVPSPYVASASSEYPGGYEAYHCFNLPMNFFWASNAVMPQWVQIDLGSSKAATKYIVQNRQDLGTHQLLGWTLEGSNNGSTWTTADVRTKGAGAGGEVFFYDMAVPGTYRYWRWTMTSSSSGTYVDCAHLALFAGEIRPKQWITFQNQDATDFGANDIDGTLNGSPTFDTGVSPPAIILNGSTQNVSGTNNPVGTTTNTYVSMSCWVNLSGTSLTGMFMKFGTGGGVGFGVGSTTTDSAGNNLVGLLENSSWMPFAVAIGTGWHHVAITSDGGATWRGYIDGVVRATTFTSAGLAPENGWKIGCDVSTRFFNGKIRDARFYGVCLSADMVAAIYAAGPQSA